MHLEGLSDDHPSKPECLLELSQLFRLAKNRTANKGLLCRASKLFREREGGYRTAPLVYTNWQLSPYEKGIAQAKKAVKFCEQLNIPPMQADYS
jgi:hypothetical protein